MIKTITQNEIIKEYSSALLKRSGMVIVEYDNMQVNYGFDAKPNFEYCQAHNIPCVDIGRRGGAFVVNNGDIGFGYITSGLDNTVGELIYNKFAEYLRAKGLNAEAKDNDVLIDGYKVFGWASNYYKEYDAIYITCHFTMSVDLELIRNVCTKPMNKIPKGLSEYGITSDEIKEFIERTIEGEL